MKFLILSIMLMLFCVTTTEARPEAKFDHYGLPYYSSIDDYQKIVGKTVMYVPQYAPSYYDEDRFQKSKGKFNTPYVITKVAKSANNRMTVYMKEKNGKGKVKMTINNKDEYYTYGKYTYCITRLYTVPLFLIDEFNADKEKFIGRKYPIDPKNQNYEITDLTLYSHDKKGYPSVCYEVKEISTDNKFYVPYADSIALNLLGAVFTNDEVKASYMIVGLKPDKYIVRNSITSKEKEINKGDYETIKTSCFNDDLSGDYIATLSNVEKPENPDIRYGETKKIDDENMTKFSYTDSHIEIVIFVSSTQFNFSLKNISDNSLKVVWNEAVYVNSKGTTSKIMHTGTKYSEKNGDQPATTIIKGAKIDDIACPTENVSYSDILKKWVTEPILPTTYLKAEMNPIRLMLPIQIKDVINEYVFEFNVDYIFNYPDRLNL